MSSQLYGITPLLMVAGNGVVFRRVVHSTGGGLHHGRETAGRSPPAAEAMCRVHGTVRYRGAQVARMGSKTAIRGEINPTTHLIWPAAAPLFSCVTDVVPHNGELQSRVLDARATSRALGLLKGDNELYGLHMELVP